MKVFHIDLQMSGNDAVNLSYFWDNPYDNTKREKIPLINVDDLIEQAEMRYYNKRYLEDKDYNNYIEKLKKIGLELYNWLNGDKSILSKNFKQPGSEGIILAIATSQGLAHLPWELLYDGTSFLVKRIPAIIPIRWVKDDDDSETKLILENKPKNRALTTLFMATSPKKSNYKMLDGYQLKAGHLI